MSAIVLICDPDPEIRANLAAAVEASGHETLQAEGPAQAAAMIRTGSPEVLLAGPGTGAQVVAGLADAVEGGAVVAVAPRASFEAARDLVAAGAAGIVPPDGDGEALAAELGRVLDRQRQRAGHSLLGASRAIFSNADRAQLPRLIVEEAMAVMDADHVSLMLLGPDEQLYVAHAHGLPAEVQASTRLALGERIAGRAALERRPIVLNSDAAQDGRFSGVEEHRRVRTCVVYPLVSGADVLGVLNISRARDQRPFGPADVGRAAVLASQVVLALENVNLIRELCAAERLAVAGQLAAGVLHEVNNPLCITLMNLADMEERLAALAEAPGSSPHLADLADAAADARRGAERIQEITADMRSLVQVDHEQRDIVDLADALRTAIRLDASDSGGATPPEASLQPGLLVRASPSMVARIFTSLIAHVRGGGGTLSLTARRERGSAVTRISGDAPDPGAEARGRIFDPFGQPPGKGRALALWLVRELVGRHGGSVAAGDDGRGHICFEVTLPLVTPGASRAA